jgi:hypothetical protein
MKSFSILRRIFCPVSSRASGRLGGSGTDQVNEAPADLPCSNYDDSQLVISLSVSYLAIKGSIFVEECAINIEVI